MIRNRGKEEFEKRVAAARDFFDSWIEHETASTDLDSLGAKMQLARQARGDRRAGAGPAHARRGREQSERPAWSAAFRFRAAADQTEPRASFQRMTRRGEPMTPRAAS